MGAEKIAPPAFFGLYARGKIRLHGGLDGQPRICLWGQAHARKRRSLAGLYQSADCGGVCLSFLHSDTETEAHGGHRTQRRAWVGMDLFRGDPLARPTDLLVERRHGIHDHCHAVGFRSDGSGDYSSRIEPGQGTCSRTSSPRWTARISVLQHLQYISTATVEALQLVQCVCFQIRSVRMNYEYKMEYECECEISM